MFYYTASLLLLSMRLFSLRPATAIRAATACALAFIVIVYTSLSALFSLLPTVFRSAVRALAVPISAALLTAVLRSARRTLAVLSSAVLFPTVLRSARRALAVLTSAALLTSVLRSARRALTVLSSAVLLPAVLRSARRTVTVLTSAVLLPTVLRSALRAVTVLSSAALLTAVLRSTLRTLSVAALHCAAVIAHLTVSVLSECIVALLPSAARTTVPLTSTVPTVALLTSAALLTSVLRSALRALSVRASFRHAARSTVVSAILRVCIQTVIDSHGPALASDGHGVVLILLQIRGACSCTVRKQATENKR